MTLEKLLNKVMVALDEAESDDIAANMEDYKYKIYECCDSCQRELAAFCAPIVRYAEAMAENGTLTLPEDCYELLAVFEDGIHKSYSQFDTNVIEIENGSYRLKYNAYPTKIDGTTPLTNELEILQEAQEAMVYGVCAGLCINDEPKLYTVYMDRYNGLVESITARREKYPKAKVMGGVRL